MAGDTYNADKHDFGVTYSGTVYGLQLAKKEGVPQWSEFDDEYLATQMFTGAAGYSSLPPEREIAFVRDDWRAGFGEDVYDSLDPKRYWSSTGCDLRHKDMAILSWAMSALTKPTTTAPTILDPGFADWDNGDLNQWVKDAGTWAIDEVTYRTTPAVDLQPDTTIHQNLATTQIQGRRFTASVWVHATDADHCRIGLNDGNDTVWGGYNTVTAAWSQISVTRTCAQDASALVIYLNVKAAGATEEFDDVTITRATLGTCTCHADYNSQMYCNLGGLLCKLTGTTFGGVYEFPAPITSLEVFGDGFMYVGLESATIIENCEDAWTGTNDTTSTLDEGDYKVGSGSAKLDYDGTGAVGDVIAYETIDQMDLQTFTGVTFWIKASKLTSNNDLAFLLDDQSPPVPGHIETILLPALVAGVWTKIYMRLATPSNCTAITSVGLEYNAGEQANIFHIDDVRAECSYYYMDSGEVFTQSTLAVQRMDSFAKYFKKVGTDCYKSLPPNSLYDTTDPSNTATDNWSTVTTVGRSTTVINSLVSEANVLYVIKETQPWYIVSGAPVLLSDSPSLMTTGAKGKNATHWQNNVIMPYGDASLFAYDTVAATFEWIEPSLYCTNLSAFDGEIQATAGDAHYLYIVVDNGSYVEVMATRKEDVDGTARRVWHPLQTQELTGCTYAFISSFPTQKRLFISSTDSTENIYYMPLPVTYGNIASDTNRDFKTGGYFETPWQHLNFKGDYKSYIKQTLSGDLKTNVLSFDGTANSYIDCGEIHNAGAKLWLSFRFKLDSDYSSASQASFYLWGKYHNSENLAHIWLASSDGKLGFYLKSGDADKFLIYAKDSDGDDITSWTAGTIYHAIASISSAEGARLRVNNWTAATDADTTALPDGGNFVIGALEAGTAGKFDGVIADFACGTDDLTTTEEASLYTGTLPSDETDWWPIDEATGTSITSYGSDATTGTAGSAYSWTTDNGGLVYFEAHYKKKGDSSYTDIGDFQTSPTTSKYLPDDGDSNKPTSTSMRFKIVGMALRKRDTPILHSYDIRAILYPTKRKYFVAEVYAADKILDKAAAEMATTAANITTYLDAARAATYPVSIRDPWGTTKTVRFLGSRATPACAISAAHKGKNIEKHYWLLLEEVTVSA